MAVQHKALIIVIAMGLIGAFAILGIFLQLQGLDPRVLLGKRVEKKYLVEDFAFLKNPKETNDLEFAYTTAKTKPRRVGSEARKIHRALAKTNLCGKWTSMTMHATRKSDGRKFTFRFTPARRKVPLPGSRTPPKPKPPTTEELVGKALKKILRQDSADLQVTLEDGLLRITYTTDDTEGFRNSDAEAACREAGQMLPKNGGIEVIEVIVHSRLDAKDYRYRYKVADKTFSGPERVPREKSLPAPKTPKETLETGQ